MTNDSHGNAPDSGRLGGFERNRFFHGKLMTARDMAVEQDYHAGRLDAVAREVLGDGIVTGLQTTVSESSGTLTVRVDPGLAMDGYGRLVLVEEQDDDETLDLDEEHIADGLSVFLHYAECKRETVAVANGGNGCEQACDYNRVREGYRLSVEPGPPDDPEPADNVVFPAPDEAALDDPTRPGPAALGLHEVAESYNASDAGTPESTAESTSGSVFLGYFVRPEDGSSEWDRRVDEEPRPYVYTNDLLYEAVSRHVGDFNNPHEVTADQTGGITSVEGVGQPGGDVDLQSDDDSVSIDTPGTGGEQYVDLTVADSIQDTIDQHGTELDEHETELDEHETQLGEHEAQLGEHETELGEHDSTLGEHESRLDAHEATLDTHDERLDDHRSTLEEHAAQLADHAWLERTQTLKYQVESFYDVVKTFPESEAGALAAQLAALSAAVLQETDVPTDGERMEQRSVYLDFLGLVVNSTTSIRDALSEEDGDVSLERFSQAIDRLEELLEEPPEGADPEAPDGRYVMQLLVAQTALCGAARLLAPAEEETIQLPGGYSIPKGLVNRPLRSSVTIQEPDSRGEGDGGYFGDDYLDTLPYDPVGDPSYVDPDLPYDTPYFPDDIRTDPTPGGPTTDPTPGGPATDPTPGGPATDPTPGGPTTDPTPGGPATNPGVNWPLDDAPLDTFDERFSTPSTTDEMPDLTGEPARNLSPMAAETDAAVEFRTPDGESVDPAEAGEQVVLDQSTGPAAADGLSRLTVTVAEPSSPDALAGIGARRRDQLAEAGYGSVEALSKADPEALAKALPRVSVSMAEEWVSLATAYVENRR